MEQVSTSQSGTITVLLADDHTMIRTLWKDMLANRLPGLRFLEAPDGLEAVRLATEIQPDLIMMDLNMPAMNGFEATRHLKSQRGTARIPIIAVTGSEFDSNAVLAVGCDGYILKPASPEHVVSEVRRLLRRPLD